MAPGAGTGPRRAASLRARLAVGFALLILLAVVMGVLGVYYTGQMRTAAERTYTQEVVPLEALDDAKSALYRIRGDALEHVVAARPDSEQRLATEIAEQERRARQRLLQYEGTRLRAPERVLLDEFYRDFDTYVRLVQDEILPLSAADRKDEAESLARGSAVGVFREARDAMNALMDYNLERARARAADVSSSYRQAIATLGVILACLLALGVLVSVRLSLAITRPIGSVIDYLRDLGAGRMDTVIPKGGHDEFGQIFAALHDTQRQLRVRTEEREQAHEQMAHQAFHDSLTGLPNRALFVDRLEHAQALQQREQRPLSVLMLDLDGFKYVNDTGGHLEGDALLRLVAERLSGCVREIDTLARLGGDEFAVLMERGSAEQAQDLANRIVDALAQPYVLAARTVQVTCSIGVAVAPGTGRVDLLRNADVALYSAKGAGKNRVAVFDDAMYQAVLRRSELQSELGAALAHGQFSLLLQPLVHMASGEITSLEALLRWRRADGEQVSPQEFIPLCEESGLIVPVGAWVLEEATRQAAHLSARVGRPVTISVNVSVLQLDRTRLAATVAAALAAADLPPQQLVLEVTESVLLAQNRVALQALETIRRAGVRVAIDDFGTGYSSLGQLRALPADILKIDRSFITEIEQASGTPVLAAVVAMAQSLGLLVVAEGVETVTQYDALRRLGCTTAQGFLMSRPLPLAEVEQLLAFSAPYAALGADLVPGDGGALRSVMAAVRAAVLDDLDPASFVRRLLAAVSAVSGLPVAYVARVDPGTGAGTVLYAHDAGGTAVAEGAGLPTGAARAPLLVEGWSTPLTASDGTAVGRLVTADVTRTTVGAPARQFMAFLARILADHLVSAAAGRGRSVLIVDDSDVSRLVLTTLLTGLGYDVVGEAADVAQALQLSVRLRPDVVLLDVELGEGSGLDGLVPLQRRHPSARIVVISGSPHHRPAALAAGASAYLDKASSPEELAAALLPPGSGVG